MIMIMARALAAKDPNAPPHALLAAATRQVVPSELVGLQKHVICLSYPFVSVQPERPTSERFLMLNIAIVTINISSQKLHVHS